MPIGRIGIFGEWIYVYENVTSGPSQLHPSLMRGVIKMMSVRWGMTCYKNDKHIWEQVILWYNNKTNQNVHISCKKVLFGKASKNALHCVNTIVLITMQYIYSCRCLKAIPNFYQLKWKILDMHNIEKYIAVKNDKLPKHLKKWKGFWTLIGEM